MRGVWRRTLEELRDQGNRRYLISLALSGVGLAALSDAFSRAAQSKDANFLAGTIVLLLTGAALCWLWPDDRPRAIGTGRSRVAAWLVAALGVAMAAFTAWRLLPSVFAGRINPYDADMLVLIENGIERVLHGQDPYTLYHVPWEAPLAYGPWLWGPYIVPHVLGVDPRVLTLIAHLFVPGACVWAASLLAARRPASAIGLVTTAALLLLNPRIDGFHRIGHTFVYWPLIFLFCWASRRDRWTASAALCGALVVARTTFVAIVPVHVLHLYFRRALTAPRLIWLLLSAAGPFLPFAVMNWASLRYALLDVYVKVMKEFVWIRTSWAHDTYGITGALLRRGQSHLVQPIQYAAMTLVYIACAIALRRGRRPEPWYAFALLVFCMTTLWPVTYVYFDVFILIASAAACDGVADLVDAPLPWRATALLLAGATVVVLAAGAIAPGSSPAIDLGTPAAAPLTGGGFGDDRAILDGTRTFEWVEGQVARVRVPRAGWTGGTIHVVARANVPPGGPRQRVSAVLNGHTLGAEDVPPDWTDVRFRAPRRDWYYGFNLLELRFSYAAAPPPGQPAVGPVAAGIDLISVGGATK
jgi:hypothetical protein